MFVSYIRESKELFAGIEHEISSHKVPRISSGLKQILDKADELAENCEREVQLLRQKALATKAVRKTMMLVYIYILSILKNC